MSQLFAKERSRVISYRLFSQNTSSHPCPVAFEDWATGSWHRRRPLIAWLFAWPGSLRCALLGMRETCHWNRQVRFSHFVIVQEGAVRQRAGEGRPHIPVTSRSHLALTASR